MRRWLAAGILDVRRNGLPAFPRTLLEFQRIFPDEAACAAYLERIRWPDGFACPNCAAVDAPWHLKARCLVLQCRHCRSHASLTAGTIMHRTKTPLRVWFWGAYLVTTQTPGMSALQFQRQLGVKRYETAFHILHKLRAATVRPDRDHIGGEWPVEVDEVWIGGRTRGEGRGVHHKTLVAGAVEVRERNEKSQQEKIRRRQVYAGRMRLQVVPDRSAETLEGFVTASVEKGGAVVTDGWIGYEGLPALGYLHQPVIINKDYEKADEFLPMVHLVFSTLKTWLQGTHHGVSAKHLQAYLNEHVFRFNRRFYPMSSFNSVLAIAVRVEGPTYESLYDGGWAHASQTDARQDVSTG